MFDHILNIVLCLGIHASWLMTARLRLCRGEPQEWFLVWLLSLLLKDWTSSNSSLFIVHYRRERADMIQVYKILHGIDRLSPEYFFKRSEYQTTRGHSLKLFNTHRKLNVRGSFFSKRVICSWNNLPESIVSASSIVAFKTRLDKLWQSKQFYVPWHPRTFAMYTSFVNWHLYMTFVDARETYRITSLPYIRWWWWWCVL